MSEQYGHSDQTDDTGRRPYSFDLTLEQQLDNESLPPLSPAAATGRPQSVDTNVLASVITQLRTSLAEVTRERDELAKSLAEFQAREADVKDAIANMSEKCSNLQDQLDRANDRSKEDENTISVLRGKVEESRRGLMRLQSESRRASQLPPQLDLSKAGTFASLPISSAKRASFAPLTGSTPGRLNAHRRISSVTDASFSRLEGNPPTPNAGSFGFTELSLPPNKAQPSPSRPSSLYQRQDSPPRSFRALEDSPEVERLRKEVHSLKTELEDVKHELSESNEAREASELCVRALRAFIEENNVGISAPGGSGTSAGSSSLLPTSSSFSQAEPKKSAPAAGGWGFKLWRAETPAAKSAAPAPAAPTPPAISGTGAPLVQPPPQPLTKKLGDFFGTRASISSFTAVPAKPFRMEQELMYNGMSDSSSVEDSVAEPVSPASDFPRPVLVRDSVSVTSGSSRDLGASPDQKAVRPSSPPAIEGPFTPVAL
ncbi:hypothetical protein BKA82DRAFT_997956 [Pisolithus tinctorius]|uniref:Uncharacterized protein n=1 Tax=Pisolithus tinctorius Marx 270 TaxID=870435 RepID=A0A0C3P452_PISTI|nr:hypothetical protein BKA82DRAFT_997956 [Pisolithus tinctorius]KIO07815.1 hypothetical protein M404DRAFT_997956 [Pisolithus tinctorius Marx 270]